MRIIIKKKRRSYASEIVLNDPAVGRRRSAHYNAHKRSFIIVNSRKIRGGLSTMKEVHNHKIISGDFCVSKQRKRSSFEVS